MISQGILNQYHIVPVIFIYTQTFETEIKYIRKQFVDNDFGFGKYNKSRRDFTGKTSPNNILLMTTRCNILQHY